MQLLPLKIETLQSKPMILQFFFFFLLVPYIGRTYCKDVEMQEGKLLCF